MRQRYWSIINEAAPRCELAAEATMDSLEFIRFRTDREEQEMIAIVDRDLRRQMAANIADRLAEHKLVTTTEGVNYRRMSARCWVFTDTQLEQIMEAAFKAGATGVPS